MLLNRTEQELNTLFRELMRKGYPRHIRYEGFTDCVEIGSHWADLPRAAALLSTTGYWGRGLARRAGITHVFPPATLRCVVNKLHVDTGEAACVFTIGVPAQTLVDQQKFLAWLPPEWRNGTGYLRGLLQFYEYGELWVHEGERKKQLEKLLGCVLEAREQAQRAKGQIRVVGA